MLDGDYDFPVMCHEGRDNIRDNIRHFSQGSPGVEGGAKVHHRTRGSGRCDSLQSLQQGSEGQAFK